MPEMQDYKVLEKFRKSVPDALGEKVYSIIVYGSVARGTATKDVLKEGVVLYASGFYKN